MFLFQAELLIYSINNKHDLGPWSRKELSKDCLDQILAQPNTRDKILGKLFNLSPSLFSHLKIEISIAPVLNNSQHQTVNHVRESPGKWIHQP